MAEQKVNPQVVDAITLTNAANLGETASMSMGMFFQLEAQAFGMGMQNAVTSQQGYQQISQAVVSVACSKIMDAAGKSSQ
jgi:hypothetical protein